MSNKIHDCFLGTYEIININNKMIENKMFIEFNHKVIKFESKLNKVEHKR